MTKIVTRRDSALKLLRKAGIKKEDYDSHLKKVPSGFEVTIPGSEPKQAAPKTGAKKKSAPKKKAEAKSAPKQNRGSSIASAIRELVAQGKDNAQIWSVIKKDFDLDDTKKYYPAWYRRQDERQAKAGK